MPRKKITQFLFLLYFTFFLPFLVLAENTENLNLHIPNVVISEICWMGSINSSSDEWIELSNNTDKEVTLTGWKLVAADDSPKISLSGVISPNGFFLLERTDDDSAPLVPADQIYKGALGNKGENLKLISDVGEVIDEVDCSSGWFSGDNKTKKTMEKSEAKVDGNNPNNWQLSKDEGGTPKAKNSEPILAKSRVDETKNNKKIEEAKDTNTENILLNEIMASPKGNDAENEWIEIYNPNDKDVDLSNWKIKDQEGKTVTYIIPKNTGIKSLGYLIFYRKDTKVILNNEKDVVSLATSNDKIIDTVRYEKAKLEYSFNRMGSIWRWSESPTPGKENIIASQLNTEKEQKNTRNNVIQEKNNNESQNTQQSLASVFTKIKSSGTSPIKPATYLTAILLATISLVAILFIKKSLN